MTVRGKKCPKKTVSYSELSWSSKLSLSASISKVCRYPGESAENEKSDHDDEDGKEAVTDKRPISPLTFFSLFSLFSVVTLCEASYTRGGMQRRRALVISSYVVHKSQRHKLASRVCEISRRHFTWGHYWEGASLSGHRCPIKASIAHTAAADTITHHHECVQWRSSSWWVIPQPLKLTSYTSLKLPEKEARRREKVRVNTQIKEKLKGAWSEHHATVFCCPQVTHVGMSTLKTIPQTVELSFEAADTQTSSSSTFSQFISISATSDAALVVARNARPKSTPSSLGGAVDCGSAHFAHYYFLSSSCHIAFTVA